MFPEPPALKRLRRFARYHGADIVQLSRAGYDALTLINEGEIYEAPFTPGLGLNWTTKKIYFCVPTSEVAQVKLIPGVIHELGHVLCIHAPPNETPDNGPREESAFLGWELLLALKIGVSMPAWCHSNRGYVLPAYAHGKLLDSGIGPLLGDFAKFDPRGFAHFLNRMIDQSTEFGMIRRGRPIALR